MQLDHLGTCEFSAVNPQFLRLFYCSPSCPASASTFSTPLDALSGSYFCEDPLVMLRDILFETFLLCCKNAVYFCPSLLQVICFLNATHIIVLFFSIKYNSNYKETKKTFQMMLTLHRTCYAPRVSIYTVTCRRPKI